MTTDQKHRNAYKRMWRNRRNYNRAIAEADRAVDQAQRSWNLYRQAVDEL